MNYRTISSIFLLFLAQCSMVIAQEEDVPDDIQDFTIELPEGMQMQEIDSLLSDWQTRNFLSSSPEPPTERDRYALQQCGTKVHRPLQRTPA